MNNTVNLLKNYRMIGQLSPWNIKDEAEPVVTLLVPVETALSEYKDYFGQDITRNDFLKALKEAGVLVFNNIDEFVKIRDNLKTINKLTQKEKKKFKRSLSEERKKQLKEQMSQINQNKKAPFDKTLDNSNGNSTVRI